MQTYDVAVVGTGIIGCMCAYALIDRVPSLILIDGAGLCAGTSRASEGNLLISDRQTVDEVNLMQISLDAWRRLASEFGDEFEYQAKGSMLVARTEADVADLASHVTWLVERGVRVELVSDHFNELEPALSPSLSSVALFPDDAQVQPMLVAYALTRRLVARGVALSLYDPVVRIEPSRGSVILDLASGQRIEAGRVLVCAGVDTPALVESLGGRLPVHPRRGHIAVLDAGVHIQRKIVDFSYNATLGEQSHAPTVEVAAVIETTLSGTILCGSSRQFAGHDRSVDLPTIRSILRACIDIVPALARLRILRAYVGLRPFSPDGMPMIGWLNDEQTVAVATGHEGAGHGLAPVTADLICRLFDRSTSPLHRLVDPRRFSADGCSEIPA